MTARDGVLVPVGCPACHTPEGGSPMQLIEHMNPTRGGADRWRRAVLECVTCQHGVLIEVTLTNLDGTQ